MIPVSMSRKTRSFDQLSAYMDSEKSDSHYDLHHNYFVRGRENIAEAFFENSKHLQSRRNGNYLYHEIISITLEDGVELRYAKDSLREITLKYISERCPRNMVYGCLHEDHSDHLHYHLMISANEQGEAKRHWLTKSQFDAVKRDLETHVLQNYPLLKQRKIITADQKEKRTSRKAAAQKRRTGKLERQEQVRDTIFRAMTHTTSFTAFEAKLKAEGFEYYQRGKHHGVKVSHDDGKVQSYRFATIGADTAFQEYLKALESLKAANDEQDGPQGQTEAFSATDAPKDDPAVQKGAEKPETPPEQDAPPSDADSREKAAENAREADRDSREGEEASMATKAKETGESETLREMRERREARAERKRAKALSQHKRKGKPR